MEVCSINMVSRAGSMRVALAQTISGHARTSTSSSTTTMDLARKEYLLWLFTSVADKQELLLDHCPTNMALMSLSSKYK